MLKKKIDYSGWSKDDLVKEINRIKETTYGLVWHRDVPQEKIDILINPDARTPDETFSNELSGKPFPVLKSLKSKDISFLAEQPDHILIEGDNYHSLAVLNFTHFEKIDIIYIDPPYNTGGEDFIYNDRFVDKEDPFRHSKWLSFMERRLRLAKNLLKEDGVIFISIDDNEHATLRMLCDEIFLETNFIANVSRLTKTTSFRGNYFAPSIDYVLCYAKNIEKLSNFVDKSDIKESQFSKIEITGPRKGEKYRDDTAFYLTTLETRPNQRYFVECPDGSKVIPPGKTFPPDKPQNGDGVWRWSLDTFNEKKDLIVFKQTKRSPLLDENGSPARWNLYTKGYLKDRQEDGKLPRNLLEGFLNRAGTSALKKLDIDFDFPKPVELIEYLITITNKRKDAVILDFFAGSGTTGHAVLNLNHEDSGSRKFILCTNNENNICEDVCYPRLTKLIRGYKNKKGELNESLPGNLKYFTAYDFVESEPTDKNKRKLVKKSSEMLCIKEGVFDLFKETEEYKIFKNPQDKYLGVIFYEDAIPEYKNELKNINHVVHTYVFSLGDDPYRAEFKDVEDKVILQPIPEVILRVYKEIFK